MTEHPTRALWLTVLPFWSRHFYPNLRDGGPRGKVWPNKHPQMFEKSAIAEIPVGPAVCPGTPAFRVSPSDTAHESIAWNPRTLAWETKAPKV